VKKKKLTVEALIKVANEVLNQKLTEQERLEFERIRLAEKLSKESFKNCKLEIK